MTAHISKGDFFLVPMLLDEVLPLADVLLPQDGATLKTNSLLMVFATADRAAEKQLHILFGLGEISERFKADGLDVSSLLPAKVLPTVPMH